LKLTIQLLRSILLEDFPSGSAINYYNEKFYITGDDATHVLILDKSYKQVDSILLFDNPEKRIAKSEKIDLEASTMAEIDGVTSLLIFGSASRKKRKRMVVIPFSSKKEINTLGCFIFNTKDFVDRIESLGLTQINLEGACLVNDKLVLGNRGNRSMQKNHLLITTKEFWKRQREATLSCIELLLPDNSEPLGISELCYISSKDILLITLTSEATDNAYDDGAIGDSYLGWITNASDKLRHNQIKADGMINLTTVDVTFKQHKIEGICLEEAKDDTLILHMVSDNDTGSTHLFNVKITLS
jgi:hypothetical protein